MDELQRLSSVLPPAPIPKSASPTATTDEDLEPVVCRTCRDAGFVRRSELRPGDEGFGRAHPCPDCGKSDGESTFYQRARIPGQYRSWRLDGVTAGHRPVVVDYVRQWPPARPLMYLWGGTGVGKSGIAVVILREVWRAHGIVGQFWVVPDLLRRYKATFDDETRTETSEQVDRILDNMPLLVLDDYGTEKDTEWSNERLFDLVDRRAREGSPTIVTSNLGLAHIPPRLASRLGHIDYSVVAELKGRDRRMAR